MKQRSKTISGLNADHPAAISIKRSCAGHGCGVGLEGSGSRASAE